MIRQWIDFIRRPDVRSRAVFLSDYDVLMAEHLVQGVDVWVNTPRRPWEACGTSGMKVLVNGGLNLSELDGWWAEAYSPEVGWAIGDRQEHGNDPSLGTRRRPRPSTGCWSERSSLNSMPAMKKEFRMRLGCSRCHGRSMAALTPRFSTNRAVRQYTEQHYLSAASAFKARAANQGAAGADLVRWKAQLANHWSLVRFGSATVEQKKDQFLFQVQVFLGDLDPEAVGVELYAEGPNAGVPVTQSLSRGERLVGSANGFTYSALIPATRPAADYTPRLVPQHKGAFVPLEAPFSLWHDSPSWRRPK